MGSRVRSRGIAVAVVFLFMIGSLALGQGKGKGRNDEPPGQEKEKKEEKASSVLPQMKGKGAWLPPGLSEEEQAEWKDGRPPGWSRGEKEGWKGGDMPPGLAKKGGRLPPGLAKKVPPGWSEWNEKKKREWERELLEARRRVRRVAGGIRDFVDEDLHSALVSVETAARLGVPIRHVLGLVGVAMKTGIKGRGIETATKAMAYGVGRQTDFEKLGKFTYKKLEDGVRDDELAIEIYREVASRHEERLKAKKAVVQEGEEGEAEEK